MNYVLKLAYLGIGPQREQQAVVNVVKDIIALEKPLPVKLSVLWVLGVHLVAHLAAFVQPGTFGKWDERITFASLLKYSCELFFSVLLEVVSPQH